MTYDDSGNPSPSPSPSQTQNTTTTPAKKTSREERARAKARADKEARKLRTVRERLMARHARKTAVAFARAVGGKTNHSKGREALASVDFPRDPRISVEVYKKIMRRIGRVLAGDNVRNWQDWWVDPVHREDGTTVPSIQAMLYDALKVSRLPGGFPITLPRVKKAAEKARVIQNVRTATRPTDVMGGRRAKMKDRPPRPKKGERRTEAQRQPPGTRGGQTERFHNEPFLDRIRGLSERSLTSAMGLSRPEMRGSVYNVGVGVDTWTDENHKPRPIREVTLRKTRGTYSWRAQEWRVMVPYRYWLSVVARNMSVSDGRVVLDAEPVKDAPVETYRVIVLSQIMVPIKDADQELNTEWMPVMREGYVTRSPVSGRYTFREDVVANETREAIELGAALDDLGML